jgi:hypothetical protein
MYSQTLLQTRCYVNSICDRKTDDLRPQSLKYNTVIPQLVEQGKSYVWIDKKKEKLIYLLISN